MQQLLRNEPKEGISVVFLTSSTLTLEILCMYTRVKRFLSLMCPDLKIVSLGSMKNMSESNGMG